MDGAVLTPPEGAFDVKTTVEFDELELKKRKPPDWIRDDTASNSKI